MPGLRAREYQNSWLFAQALDTTPELRMNLQNQYDLALNRPQTAIEALRKTG